MNRYFILPNPNPNSAIWDIVIESVDTVRTNLAGNKMVVKLPISHTQKHPMLNGIQEYTHEEILIEMAKLEWTATEEEL